MELRHIRAAVVTESVFNTDGDEGQRAITTDTENYVYKNQTNTKSYTLARQSYFDGSTTYLDNKFASVEIYGDLFVNEYIRKFGYSNYNIRFTIDSIETNVNGIEALTVKQNAVGVFEPNIDGTFKLEVGGGSNTGSSIGNADNNYLKVGNTPQAFIGGYYTDAGDSPTMYIAANLYYNGAWIRPDATKNNSVFVIDTINGIRWFNGTTTIGTFPTLYIKRDGQLWLRSLSTNLLDYSATVNIEDKAQYFPSIALFKYNADTTNSDKATGFIGISDGTSRLWLSGGSRVTSNPGAGTWVTPTSNYASMLYMDLGEFNFYGDDSLISETSYTPSLNMKIDVNGNVTAYNYSYGFLKVENNANPVILQGSLGGGAASQICFNLLSSVSGTLYEKNGYAHRIISSSATGSLVFQLSSSSGIAGNAVSLNQNLALLANGNVGIYTNSPNSKLSVNGSINQEERVWYFTDTFATTGAGTDTFDFDLGASSVYFNLYVSLNGVTSTNDYVFGTKEVFTSKLLSNVLTTSGNTVIFAHYVLNGGAQVSLSISAVGSSNQLRITVTGSSENTTGKIFFKFEAHNTSSITKV